MIKIQNSEDFEEQEITDSEIWSKIYGQSLPRLELFRKVNIELSIW